MAGMERLEESPEVKSMPGNYVVRTGMAGRLLPVDAWREWQQPWIILWEVKFLLRKKRFLWFPLYNTVYLASMVGVSSQRHVLNCAYRMLVDNPEYLNVHRVRCVSSAARMV